MIQPDRPLKEAIDDLCKCEERVGIPTISAILKKCGLAKALSEGKRLHAFLRRHGLQKNLLLGNLLMRMYADCGSFHDAKDSFAELDQRNKFSWNFYVTGYARHGCYEQVMHVFNQMQWEGFIPDEYIYTSILSACSTAGDVGEGKRMHARLVGNTSAFTVAVQNALVNMYGKVNCVQEALKLFNETSDRNVVSWTAIIGALAQNGLCEEAHRSYYQMQCEGVLPNKVTLTSIVDLCTVQPAPIEGKRVHACIVGNLLESELVLATGLVNMYAKYGNLEIAHGLFEWMPERNAFSWTALIGGYVQHGYPDEGLQLFGRMLVEGVPPDKVTISSILDACGSQVMLDIGRLVHAMIVVDDSEYGIVLATSLVDMYGKCCSLEDARTIFDRMQVRNVLSWTAMIEAYAQHGDSKQVFDLFDKMQRAAVVADKVILYNLVDTCASEVALREGKLIHDLILGNSLESDALLATALVNMYGKCGKLDDSQSMFDKLAEKDVVSWTAMIGSYAQHGYDKEALVLFNQMQQEGVIPNRVTYVSVLPALASEPSLMEGRRVHAGIVNSELQRDVVVMTALVHMYVKCGRDNDARTVFSEMGERNVVSWNTMIAPYAQCGDGEEALDLFDQMQQEGFAPNKATFVSILDACASQATLNKGESMHALAVHGGFDLDIDVANAAIHMYGKCGRLDDAEKVFDQMLEHDVVTWNTLIGAFAQHGHPKVALKLFDRMQGVGCPPDKLTFVSALYACSHSGLVEKGRSLFFSMTKDYGITPIREHYHCMVHILALSGLIEAAEDVISKMPFQPTPVTWMHLLSACRDHVDVPRGEQTIKHMIELDAEDASPYVMLSNLYAAGSSEYKCGGNLILVNMCMAPKMELNY